MALTPEPGFKHRLILFAFRMGQLTGQQRTPHFGGGSPLPLERGEGQGEGWGRSIEHGSDHRGRDFSPSPLPSPPRRGRGRMGRWPRMAYCHFVVYLEDPSVTQCDKARPAPSAVLRTPSPLSRGERRGGGIRPHCEVIWNWRPFRLRALPPSTGFGVDGIANFDSGSRSS